MGLLQVHKTNGRFKIVLDVGTQRQKLRIWSIYLRDDVVTHIGTYDLYWYRLHLTVVRLTINVTYIHVLMDVLGNKGYTYWICKPQLCWEILTWNLFFFRIYKNDARLILLSNILLDTWKIEFWRKILVNNLYSQTKETSIDIEVVLENKAMLKRRGEVILYNAFS